MKNIKKSLLVLAGASLLSLSSCYTVCPEAKDCPTTKKVEKTFKRTLKLNYDSEIKLLVGTNKTIEVVEKNPEDTVTFSSSDPEVATCTSNGLVTPVTPNKHCVITAKTSSGLEKKLDCNTYSEDTYFISDGQTTLVRCVDSIEERKNITSLTLPNGFTSTKDRILEGFTNLKKLVIPEGYTSLGNFSLLGCTSLEELSIPSTLHTIGYQVGIQNSLNQINIASDNNYLVVNERKNLLMSTSTNPGSLKKTVLLGYNRANGTIYQADLSVIDSIGPFAFATSNTIGAISMTSGINSIGQYAYARSSIKSLIFPKAIQDIGYSCLAFCSNLSSVSRATNGSTVGNAYSQSNNLILKSNIYGLDNTYSLIGGTRAGVDQNSIDKFNYTAAEPLVVGAVTFANAIKSEKLVLHDKMVYLDILSFGYNPNLKHVFLPASIQNAELTSGTGQSYIKYLFYYDYQENIPGYTGYEKVGPFAGCNDDLTLYTLAEENEEPSEDQGEGQGEEGSSNAEEETKEELVDGSGRSQEVIDRLTANVGGKKFAYKVITKEEYNAIFGEPVEEVQP